MSDYTLSVVLLIPAAHKDAINALAQEMGHGPDNISRKLVNQGGAVWYGGHTLAAPEFLTDLGGLPPSAALAALVVSVRSPGQVDENDNPLSDHPLTHWNQVMEANGLASVEPEHV